MNLIILWLFIELDFLSKSKKNWVRMIDLNKFTHIQIPRWLIAFWWRLCLARMCLVDGEDFKHFKTRACSLIKPSYILSIEIIFICIDQRCWLIQIYLKFDDSTIMNLKMNKLDVFMMPCMQICNRKQEM